MYLFEEFNVTFLIVPVHNINFVYSALAFFNTYCKSLGHMIYLKAKVWKNIQETSAKVFTDIAKTELSLHLEKQVLCVEPVFHLI